MADPAAALKFFFLLLLPASSLGLEQPGCIQVNQRTTGAFQGFDFEFEVEIENACACAQRNVRVDAPGFMTQRPVDPAALRRDGEGFLVAGGDPIAGGAAVRFTYWWDHATFFIPAGSLPAC